MTTTVLCDRCGDTHIWNVLLKIHLEKIAKAVTNLLHLEILTCRLNST